MPQPLAVVTGASTGIGKELAICCAENGFDLVIAADEPEIHAAARELEGHGHAVTAVKADLATAEGNDEVYKAVAGRPIAALLANVGRGLGHGFLDQDFGDIRRVVDTNITGFLYLTQRIGRDMRQRGEGRILITGSIAGLMPGSFQAVYNGTKAFADNFGYALRNELKDTGVSVTVLMPGPTDTEFFRRAGMEDTPVGQDDSKEDPAKTARTGFDAMMKGEAGVVSGIKNKLEAAASHVIPDTQLAEMHRKMAKPDGQ